MVAEKRTPALRSRPRVAAHIPSDCRLSDLEAELEQFTMNAWGAPKRVRTAHFANERAQLSRDLRSANMVARSPAPIRSKPARCQRMIVSGLTIAIAPRTAGNQ